MAASAAKMVEQKSEQLTSSEAFFKHFQLEVTGIVAGVVSSHVVAVI
jgi:hypothetical protein